MMFGESVIKDYFIIIIIILQSWTEHVTNEGVFKARRGSGFYEMFCIFANYELFMYSWNFFYVVKYRFSIIPKCLFR